MAKSHADAVRLRQVLKLFALLGHSIRIVILQRLAREPMAAGELAQTLPVSRTAIVQHLKLLESAGVVCATYLGKRRVYRLRADGLRPIAQWIEKVSGEADGRART
jgi:DNA-binding transcriptional ArsR family regulator